jgi:CheY-like chemotaxis protein/HPt (histidine-containing phosphotransfer) domain-containing protein
MSVQGTDWRARTQPIVVLNQLAPRRFTARILLAEDNPVNQKVALGALERLGYMADVVGNGSAAVIAWQTGRYALILMDCQMPVMDGYQATREIRLLERGGVRTPIIALTADAMVGTEQQCRDAGMDAYLTKPLDRALLDETISRHLPASRVHQGAAESAAPVVATDSGAADRAPNAPTPTGADAPVDWDMFMATNDGDSAFAAELIEVFIDSGDAVLRDIRDALERGDLSAVRKAAHSLKGSTATMRARASSEAAALLEAAARSGDMAMIPAPDRNLILWDRARPPTAK